MEEFKRPYCERAADLERMIRLVMQQAERGLAEDKYKVQAVLGYMQIIETVNRDRELYVSHFEGVKELFENKIKPLKLK